MLNPAARADLITLAMFVFICTWSDFLWPLIILDDPYLFTLPLGLLQLSSSFSLDWPLMAAGSVVSIVPVLLRFVLLQRYILPSASGEGVKCRRGAQSLAGTIRAASPSPLLPDARTIRGCLQACMR